jgi:hypothetical protein
MASERATPSTRKAVRVELQAVIEHLRQLQSTLAVAVGALRHQNADIDADIANLLQRSIGDTLQEQIQALEAIVRRLPAARPRRH